MGKVRIFAMASNSYRLVAPRFKCCSPILNVASALLVLWKFTRIGIAVRHNRSSRLGWGFPCSKSLGFPVSMSYDTHPAITGSRALQAGSHQQGARLTQYLILVYGCEIRYLIYYGIKMASRCRYRHIRHASDPFKQNILKRIPRTVKRQAS